MKITKQRLREIIRKEIKVLKEFMASLRRTLL